MKLTPVNYEANSSAAFAGGRPWGVWRAGSRWYVDAVRGERLVLVGCASVELVRGRAEIHGFELAKKRRVPVASFSWQPCVCLRPLTRRCVVAFSRPSEAPPLNAKIEIALLFDGFGVLRVSSPREAWTEFGVGATVVPRSWRTTKWARIVVIVGEKNAGKSTAARYAVNRILSTGQQPSVLDCDPGQPLRGAPAMLSLFTPSQPLLQAPHCAALESDVVRRQFYFGDVTPRDAPATYASCIGELLQTTPYDRLVVNTCGWTRGLGAEILTSVVDALPEAQVYVVGCRPACIKPSAVELESIVSDVRSASAQQQRALQLAAYFARLSPGGLPGPTANAGALADPSCALARYLASCPPYYANLDDLTVAFVGSARAPATDLLSGDDRRDNLRAILNGGLVGLASTTDMSRPLDVGDDAAWRVPCRALALVAGFDCEDVLLLTPSPDRLEHCDLLLKGTLAPTVHLLNQGRTAASFPYLSCESIHADLAAPMRSTRTNVRGDAPPS